MHPKLLKIDECIGKVNEISATIIVIPAYNEGATIEKVVAEVKHYGVVLVIDDGSSDDTAKLARSAGANVVSHPSNYGYDAALETGIKTALSIGGDFIITFDGDGQHDSICLEQFILELNNGADAVIGVRNITQRWSEHLFCIVGRKIWNVSDPLCGIKGYRLNLLSNIGHISSYNSIGTELTLRLINNGCNLAQVSILIRPRADKSRFGSDLFANLRILKAILIGLFLTLMIRLLSKFRTIL